MATFDFNERTFVRGEGCTLVDERRRRVFDAISSVWTTIHGHGHPYIIESIAEQAAILDHATALGAANWPAIELAERLARLSGLERVFFSSDGASAVEVALKMALQYWQNTGDTKRRRFARLVHSYHGDTAATMSVSDIPPFKERFAPVLFESIPYEGAAETLARDDLAAVIVEPGVQAAAGMQIVPKEHYAALSNMKPLLIVDEIATGFGRTGAMFAFTELGLQPDIMCLGKGLTGGTLPLSATLAREYVYEAFLGDFKSGRHLFHGHSYAANPICCAAALASLDVFDREQTLSLVAELDAVLEARLAPLQTHPGVREVRRKGLMCAIELETQALEIDDPRSTAWGIADRMYAAGHFTRPLGDAVQLVPPLSSSMEELLSFADALEEELDAAAHA
jgi:adenosylmethionine-8-amino-7-oxononanoate transaminase